MNINQIIFIPLLSIVIVIGIISAVFLIYRILKESEDLVSDVMGAWLILTFFTLIVGISIGGIRILIISGHI